MVTKGKTGKKGSKGLPKDFNLAVIGKPLGVIQPRVKDVGPEHFGVVSVDCAKARSKMMFADFYGRVLIKPTVIEHDRSGFEKAIQSVKQAINEHDIKDNIVCVEMTGTYDQIVVRAFREARFEVRMVHPFASSHYRAPESGDVKTDDRDLIAIFRAAVNGFGLTQPAKSELDQKFLLLVRHRRDLVNKKSKLQMQIHGYIERCLPGYAAMFFAKDFWRRPIALALLRFIAAHGGTPRALLDAGIPGVTKWLKEQKCGFLPKSVERAMAWAANAAQGDPLTPTLTRIWQGLLNDWQQKIAQIHDLERDLAGLLVQTPWILTLSHPGINVVSASELAAETGPIEYYASAKAISGRAGLFPSRYQSDGVDRNGPLSKFRNRRIRSAWLLVADNLIKCNAYWRGKYELWKSRGVDGRDIRCRVANRVTRTIYQMVAGKKLFNHPSRLDRSYILDKLLAFHREHGSSMKTIQADLVAAAKQIPQPDWTDEAKPLIDIQRKSINSRKSEPQELGALLIHVLAKLGVTTDTPSINSSALEAPDDDAGVSDR